MSCIAPPKICVVHSCIPKEYTKWLPRDNMALALYVHTCQGLFDDTKDTSFCLEITKTQAL